jgi:hypothetical protein
MPPSYNAEVKEISQRMAHLSALLDIPRPTSEFKILWFEYRDLKARRKVIEAEDEAGTRPRTKPNSKRKQKPKPKTKTKQDKQQAQSLALSQLGMM